MDGSIRVLIVDDSLFMRRALTKLIEAGRGLEVAGTACNGIEALACIEKLHPDVVTLDLEMPQMDGITALEAIMRRCPLPVLMLSSITEAGAELTMRCLELGAVDFITKPAGDETLESIRYRLWLKIRQAAGAHVSPSDEDNIRKTPKEPDPQPRARAKRIIAIGASTGGPRTLQEILQALPASLPAGLLIVQHMPPNFTAVMAQRFNTCCNLTIAEAREGDAIVNGQALIAPGGLHLGLTPQGSVHLNSAPALWGVRPAVDVMMTDVATVFGQAALGIVLTGMGRDGAQGLLRMKQAGGTTIVQDEASCVVFGMPRAALEVGAAETALPPSEIAAAIVDWCKTAYLAQSA